MSSGRTGEYRLKRQRGVGYFGQVLVRLAAAEGDGPPVVWRVDADDRSSFQPGFDDEFVTAALAGAAEGLSLASRCGADPGGLVVEVVHVQFDLTDVEVSAVRAAGVLAVAEAFDVADWLELRFDGGWGVDFVAP